MELGVAVNKFADSIGANKGIATILDSPFHTALLITMIIVIILVIQTREFHRFATYFYIFCAVLVTIFVYHRRFDKVARAEYRRSEVANALAVVPSFQGDPEAVSIVPSQYIPMVRGPDL